MNSQNVLVSVPVYTKMLDLDNDKLKSGKFIYKEKKKIEKSLRQLNKKLIEIEKKIIIIETKLSELNLQLENTHIKNRSIDYSQFNK